MDVKRVDPMEELMMELDSSLYDDDLTVETVQLIKVRFMIKKQVEFGDEVRMVGGHESMGGSPSQVPGAQVERWRRVGVGRHAARHVDGVFVYKYVVTDASDPGKPVAWQKGNNQVLTLMASDAHAARARRRGRLVRRSQQGVHVPGGRKQQDAGGDAAGAALGDADAALHESRMEIMDLKVEVKSAQMAIRRAARGGEALLRVAPLKLKQQLAAEKREGARCWRGR